MPKLFIISGPMEGQGFALKQGHTLIGRAMNNDIRINDPSISREHLRITRDGQRFLIEDLGSQNGTLINDQALTPGRTFELEPGVPIAIGGVLMSLGKPAPPGDTLTRYTLDLHELNREGKGPVLYDETMITNRKDIELIHEVSTTLMRSLDVNEICEKIMASLFTHFSRIDSGSVLIMEPETGKMEEIITRARKNERAIRGDYSRTIVDRVVKEGKAVIMPDTGLEDKVEISKSIAIRHIKSVMCVPLISGAKTRGAIYVHSVNLRQGFRKEDLLLFTALSSPAAVAVENALLFTKTREAERALRKSQEELEKRVEERTRALDMRVREITCLYGISRLQLRPQASIGDILSGVVEMIPPALRYPEKASVRIILDDRTVASPDFSESGLSLSRPITVNDREAGALEVFYGKTIDTEGDRPFLWEEETLLTVIAEQIGKTVEHKRAEEALLRAREMEVEIGSRIQQTLLLGVPPHDVQGIRVAALTIPSQRIDGDFYDFFRQSDRCLDIIVGDVMGKGVPAALLGAGIKSHFFRAMSDLIPALDHLPDPEEIVTRVHGRLVKELMDVESFVTLCYARFQLDRHRLEIIDCGHTRTIHFHHPSQTCSILQGYNVPLGFKEQEIYRSRFSTIEEGDTLFFYSDGVTEARNGKGEFFGESRLMDCIMAYDRLDPEGLIREIHEAVVSFSDTKTFGDDFTCVAVKIRDMQAGRPSRHSEMVTESGMPKLEGLRDFVRQFCLDDPDPPLDETGLWQLELAVNEAAANVMEHAYRGRSGRKIHIEAEAFPDRILIRLHHWGQAFESPESLRPPPPEDFQESGYGLFLIDSLLDGVTYSSGKGGKNSILLMKNKKCV